MKIYGNLELNQENEGIILKNEKGDEILKIRCNHNDIQWIYVKPQTQEDNYLNLLEERIKILERIIKQEKQLHMDKITEFEQKLNELNEYINDTINKNTKIKCKHDWKVISRGKPFKVQDGDILVWEKSRCTLCGEERKQMEDY